MRNFHWRFIFLGIVCIFGSGASCRDCNDIDHGTDAGVISDAAEPECPTPNGSKILHSHDIVADEAWAGDGSVHVVPHDIAVRPGATLTLEPCAVVQIGPRSSIAVFGDRATKGPARLIATGTATRPVTISRADDREGWSALRTGDGASFLDLSYTTIEGGGTESSPMVTLIGDGGGQSLVLSPTLRAISLTLRGATNCALSLRSGAAFTADSTAVTITGGGPPSTTRNSNGDLQITPQALNTLPPAVAIHDNQQNRIQVSAFGGILQIERDTRLRDHGVPYYFVFDSVRVHSRTAIPRLTIEAGVHLLFDSTLEIGRDLDPPEPGILEVLGEPGKEVVFGPATLAPMAGDWPGILLEAAAGSRISHARIEHAGGRSGIVTANCRPTNSSDDAALMIGPYTPSPTDFSDVAIVDSAGHGINSIWKNPTLSFGPDVTAGFTFTQINGCRQTKNGVDGNNCGHQEGCLVD
jgi:hypothetical protein